MSDIFREVDEDIRREQYKKLWDRYGAYVLGLAVLIVVATAGYRGWLYWNESRAQATGDRFAAALRLSAEGKHQEAGAALDAIAKDGSGSYPILASFRAAAEKASAGDTKGAVGEYEAIAQRANTPGPVRDLARLRAGLLQVETGSVADLETRLGYLAQPDNPWRNSAREILGLTAWRTNDLATARKYFDAIATDREAPQDLRSRAQFMLALITAKLGAPPAPTTPEATSEAEPEG